MQKIVNILKTLVILITSVFAGMVTIAAMIGSIIMGYFFAIIGILLSIIFGTFILISAIFDNEKEDLK